MHKPLLLVLGASLLLASCGTAPSTPAQGNAGNAGNAGAGLAPLHLAEEGGIAGQYIVVFKAGAAPELGAQSANLAAAFNLDPAGLRVQHLYSQALSGFAAGLSAQNLQTLRADPRVDYVEQDQTMWANQTVQQNAPWGLDRTDQRALPLDKTYTHGSATSATAYIIDTGIRASHSDFGGRVIQHVNTTGDGQNTDCNGHGTHVAGTVGGAVSGVTKDVALVGVKVLTCNGGGTNSGVIAGVDWVAAQAGARKVANMSLGGGASAALDTAVNNLAASGAVVVVAAGNDGRDACRYSPARASGVYTVGSTTNTDARSSFSNFGSCVDIFAPGSGIYSAWHTGDTVFNTISGTSMASPHVAGAAAALWHRDQGATARSIESQLTSTATTGVVGNAGRGSPNRLLYLR